MDPDTYSEPCQTSNKKLLVELVNCYKNASFEIFDRVLITPLGTMFLTKFCKCIWYYVSVLNNWNITGTNADYYKKNLLSKLLFFFWLVHDSYSYYKYNDITNVWIALYQGLLLLLLYSKRHMNSHFNWNGIFKEMRLKEDVKKDIWENVMVLCWA